MRYLVITNVERLEAERFMVAMVYRENGYLADTIIKPYENDDQVIEVIREELYSQNQVAFDIWTADRDIYVKLLTIPGMNVSIKHGDDVADTKRAIESIAEMLIDFYEIKRLKPLTLMPKWRRWLFIMLTKLTTKLKGDYRL